ncbi:MAG: DUF721 domain-containing protein [Saprospiraceae bacterium]|nr:DUF721 domain-containing protein [Saprospiraceae bacterium]
MIRKHNDQPLKEILQEWIKSRKMENRLNLSRIREVWSEEMGTSINQYTREMKIIRRKLFIAIDSAPLREELHLNRDKIRVRMNAALGEEYLEEVVVRG